MSYGEMSGWGHRSGVGDDIGYFSKLVDEIKWVSSKFVFKVHESINLNLTTSKYIYRIIYEITVSYIIKITYLTQASSTITK